MFSVFFVFAYVSLVLLIWTWRSVSRPLEPVLGRKFHVDSDFEVQCFISELQRRIFLKCEIVVFDVWS